MSPRLPSQSGAYLGELFEVPSGRELLRNGLRHVVVTTQVRFQAKTSALAARVEMPSAKKNQWPRWEELMQKSSRKIRPETFLVRTNMCMSNLDFIYIVYYIVPTIVHISIRRFLQAKDIAYVYKCIFIGICIHYMYIYIYPQLWHTHTYIFVYTHSRYIVFMSWWAHHFGWGIW